MAGVFAGRARRRATGLAAATALSPDGPALSALTAITDAEAAFTERRAPGPAPDASPVVEPAPVPRTPRQVGRGVLTTVREILRGLATAYLSAYVGLFAWSMIPLVFGWTPTVIISGSMQPLVGVGDVVYFAPEAPAGLTPGRVILVRRADGTLLSHRLKERREDGTLITQGDANRAADSTPVAPSQVVGAARLIIPHVGKVTLWTPEHRTSAALWTTVSLAALLLAKGAPTLAGRASPRPRRRVRLERRGTA